MEEKVTDWEALMDEGMLELERILDRLDECLGPEKYGSAETVALSGKLVNVLDRLVRCAEGGRETAQGEQEKARVEARIALFKSVRKFMLASYKKEASLKLTWN